MLLLSQIIGFGSSSLVVGRFIPTAVGETLIIFAKEGTALGGPARGTMVAEPVPDYPVDSIYWNVSGNESYVYLTGDALSLVAGKSVWLNGVNYGVGNFGFGFDYDSGLDVTFTYFSPPLELLADEENTIVIK